MKLTKNRTCCVVFNVVILISLTTLTMIRPQTDSQASAVAIFDPVVIDFENLSTTGPGQGGQVVVSDQYAGKGIIFNSPVALDYSKGVAISDFAHSGAKAIEQCYSKEFCATPIEMSFTVPQRRVKVWVGYSARLNEPRTVVLRAFDVRGTQVGQATTTLNRSESPQPIRTPLEVISQSANITRAVVSFSPETILMNGLAIDDIEFDSVGPSPTIVDLVRQSNIIFKGTVQKLNATTLPIIPVTDSTVIVRIDEILLAPQAVSRFTGREITVKLSKPGSVALGLQSVFFTQGWLGGASIAVLEAGRIDNVGDTASLRMQITAAQQTIADEDLRIYLASAELIIVGRVSEVRDVTMQAQGPPLSEHDPQLREAVVQVESVEKGQLPTPTVAIQFANSTDVVWADAPKFRLGQDGIFILHRTQIPGSRAAALTALDPRDFQPRDQLERIRRLIRG